MAIRNNVEKIFKELPKDIKLVAATKGRSIHQIKEAVEAGVDIIGENYVKEAEEKFKILGSKPTWHLIGHLQKNKVKRSVRIFDMIETVDSLKLAEAINRECEEIGKVMPVLIEVNSAKESQKSGVMPNKVEGFIKEILPFKNLRLQGLMTMGPLTDDYNKLIPLFKQAKDIFERIKHNYKNVLDWKYLSMGMSDSYKIAIQEGANMVRIGTAIFGPRR